MQPKFNVGDRVVYVDDVNMTGTIIQVDLGRSYLFYKVAWDDPYGIVAYGWEEEELHLAASQELANAAEV